MIIYLDNAATTLPAPEVIGAVTDTLRRFSGNPSSLHSMGREAGNLLRDSRAAIANALGAQPDELYFTSGGTESDSWAIWGAIHAMRHKGGHIITTAIEHDAVLSPIKELERRGYTVTYLQPDKAGKISLTDLEAALRADTVLVSIMLVNNETGAIQPVKEIANITRALSPAIIHCDAVQGFLKLPFEAGDLGVDTLSISAHKLHGPKGIGALWIRRGLRLPPLLRGGGQENGLRSGTEALHNIAGFAKAVELSYRVREEIWAHLDHLQEYFRHLLTDAIPEARLLPKGAPHIVSLSLPGWKSEVLMNYLDSKGIAVSHASACKKGGRSHVLAAMGLDSKVIDGTIRVSFSKDTTTEEIDTFIAVLQEASSTIFKSL